VRLPLKSVQAFEAAARLGSLGAAAQELFVTPSAISHQVKLLEQHYGAKLFHRVHRSVVLTDVGKQYAAALTDAFNRIETAGRRVGRAAKSDMLTIHCAPSIAAQWLMPRLARFSALHPDIDVRVNASTGFADLSSGAEDVDIRYGQTRAPASGLLVVPFPQERVVPLCAPSFVRKRRRTPRMDDFAGVTLIHSESCLVQWNDWLADHPFLQEVDTTRGPRFDRSFMSVNAAADGIGLCLESLFLVERELETGRLVAPFGFDGLRVAGYTFNVRKERAELPKIQWFRSWIFDEIARSAKRFE
jgi:LysR family transcriptional regulator, glycine cleavage system transcriptional activator